MAFILSDVFLMKPLMRSRVPSPFSAPLPNAAGMEDRLLRLTAAAEGPEPPGADADPPSSLRAPPSVSTPPKSTTSPLMTASNCWCSLLSRRNSSDAVTFAAGSTSSSTTRAQSLSQLATAASSDSTRPCANAWYSTRVCSNDAVLLRCFASALMSGSVLARYCQRAED